LTRLRRSRRWTAAIRATHGGAVHGRRTKVRTELPIAAIEAQQINRLIASFLVRDELEAIGEQTAQHEKHLRRRTGQAWLNIAFRFGRDVEPIRRHPPGAADDLETRKRLRLPISYRDQIPHWDIGRREPASGLETNPHRSAA
jgi:hypothetical protein